MEDETKEGIPKDTPEISKDPNVIKKISTPDLINELSKRNNITLINDCGRFAKHEAKIMSKYSKERNAHINLPERFSVLIIDEK